MLSLFDLPHVEARRLLARGVPVWLTINPVEYHGPHLSLHNDRLLSVGVAKAVHAQLAERHPDWPFLVADDMEMGVEPCAGIGSRRSPYLLAREHIREACRALAELGARRVVLMTFHGSPLHNLAIEGGVELLRELGVRVVSPFNLLLRQLLDVDAREYLPAFDHIPERDRPQVMEALPHDFHAGFFETSLALHYAPQSVSPMHLDLPPCPDLVPVPAVEKVAQVASTLGMGPLAAELGFAAHAMAWSALRPFPGYTSWPRHASTAAGKYFADTIEARYLPVIDDVLAGRAESPAPIMRWTASLSLGGRIGALPVPTPSELMQFVTGPSPARG